MKLEDIKAANEECQRQTARRGIVWRTILLTKGGHLLSQKTKAKLQKEVQSNGDQLR